jgi:hypothetical protein
VLAVVQDQEQLAVPDVLRQGDLRRALGGQAHIQRLPDRGPDQLRLGESRQLHQPGSVWKPIALPRGQLECEASLARSPHPCQGEKAGRPQGGGDLLELALSSDEARELSRQVARFPAVRVCVARIPLLAACEAPGENLLIETACLIVGLCGVQSDATLLERMLVQKPSPMGVRAVSYFGDVNLVPPLIQLLGEEKLKSAAAEALERITAAGLKSDVEPGPPVQIVDPAVWSSWWSGNRERFTPDRRFRLGRPYGPSAVIEELDRDGNRIERLRAYLELCRFAGPDTPRFHPLDFIPRQEESIKALRQWVEAHPNLDRGQWAVH